MIKSFLFKYWKIILIIVVAGAGIIYYFNKSDDIKTTQIKRGDLQEEMVLSGEISAINYAKLSFETAGKIVYVGVKEGEKVNKGKLISKLDTTVLNSSYQIALSNLRIYEATVDNVHDQVKDHSGDETYAQKDSRTTAEANKDKAYESVISAKRNLEGASLLAPFSGVVTYVAHPFSNVYASLGSVEAEIIDPKTMYFRVLADQTEITKVQKDQEVEISLDSFENQIFKGKVDSISFVPETGESSTTYEIKVLFNGLDLENSKFKIAMTGDSKFIVSEKNNILHLPNNYIKQDKEGKYIKINKKGEKLYIKTGIEAENDTEVLGDITEGQVVYD